MSRQVKTPRFYVDIPTFLHATGELGWDDYYGGAELLYMNPSNPYINDTQSDFEFGIGHLEDNNPKTSFPINFCALLNHNLASDTSTFTTLAYKGLVEEDESDTRLERMDGYQNVLNSTVQNNNPEFNGTSIWTFTEVDAYWRAFGLYFVDTPDDYPHQLGSFVVGRYWDAPHSPDLSLTMSRRFDGIKRQKTINGKTLANIYYDSPTEWTMHNPTDGTYPYPPFELDLPTTTDPPILYGQRAKSGLGRKGLRSWKLTFSYISESDMWIDNEVSNTLINDSEESSYANPMLSDDSFNFVWNCTLGGTLPFIFQPDGPQYDSSGDKIQGNNNPDQFSICTFRGNSLSVKQVAHNTYSLSITIDEVA